MPNNLVVPSPYLDDIDDREGRVAFGSTPLEWFNRTTDKNPGGADETIPYPYEISHTREGDIVILERDENNRVKELSGSRDLREKFEALEKKHIFDNAEAFIFNSAVNVLFFDENRQTVAISPERVFSSDYKFWTIRSVNEPSGNPIYYVGVQASDGSGQIVTNLIETTPKLLSDGTEVGRTCSGFLIGPTMMHGHNYIVQFFDSTKTIIDQMSFQAYNVRGMAHDMNPSLAIKDIKFDLLSTNPLVIQRGGSWEDLNFRVLLVFADGTTRDVTSEWIVGGSGTGRVMIKGLEHIDTSQITPTGSPGYPIELIYFTSTTNIENPHVNPVSMSISHKYYVKVVEHGEYNITTMLPVLWTTGEDNPRYCMKIFSIIRDPVSKRGHFMDYTYATKKHMLTPSGEMPSIDGTFTLENEHDPGAAYYKHSKMLTSHFDDSNTIIIPKTTSSSEPPTDVKYFFKTKFNKDTRLINHSKVNTTSVANATEMKKQRFIKLTTVNTGLGAGVHMKFVSTESDPNVFVDKLKEEFSVGDVVPTHIRIRNGKNPSIMHINIPLELTVENLVSNGPGLPFIQYDNGSEYFVTKFSPLVVEFINRSYDAQTKSIVIDVLGIETFYVQKDN